MEKLLKCSEVAKLLSISEDRLYTLVRWNIIPSVKIGRSIRFSTRHIQQFVENGGKALPR